MNLGVYLVGIFSVFCYAGLSALSKKVLSGIPLFAYISVTMILLGLFSGAASVFYEKDFSLAKLTVPVWGGMLLASTINFIAIAAYLYAIERMPITHYQLMYILSPVIGGIVAYFLLNEPFKPQALVGLLLMGAGLFVAVRDWA